MVQFFKEGRRKRVFLLGGKRSWRLSVPWLGRSKALNPV